MSRADRAAPGRRAPHSPRSRRCGAGARRVERRARTLRRSATAFHQREHAGGLCALPARPGGPSRSQTVIYHELSASLARETRDPYMILPLERHVHDVIADAVRRTFQLTDVPAFAVEVPPTRALGDLAVPVAFQLARPLRKAPRAIAQELAQAVGEIPGVSRIVATPNGYLNLFLDRE